MKDDKELLLFFARLEGLAGPLFKGALRRQQKDLTLLCVRLCGAAAVLDQERRSRLLKVLNSKKKMTSAERGALSFLSYSDAVANGRIRFGGPPGPETQEDGNGSPKPHCKVSTLLPENLAGCQVPAAGRASSRIEPRGAPMKSETPLGKVCRLVNELASIPRATRSVLLGQLFGNPSSTKEGFMSLGVLTSIESAERVLEKRPPQEKLFLVQGRRTGEVRKTS